MYCANCGNYIDDNALVCPHCGAPVAGVNQPSQPQYQQPEPQYQQPQPQYQQPQPQYQQPQPQYQQPQPQYQQPQPPQYQTGAPFMPAASGQGSKAKTLAIVGLVLGFFIPLVGWICGGMGMSKANAALALNPADPDASTAKKLATAALIVASVSFVIGIIGSAAMNS